MAAPLAFSANQGWFQVSRSSRARGLRSQWVLVKERQFVGFGSELFATFRSCSGSEEFWVRKAGLMLEQRYSTTNHEHGLSASGVLRKVYGFGMFLSSLNSD